MTGDAHPSREAMARSDADESLVALLVAYIDQAYVTAGQPGAIAAVRDMFRRMNPAEVRNLAYQLDLAAEPPAEGREEPT